MGIAIWRDVGIWGDVSLCNEILLPVLDAQKVTGKLVCILGGLFREYCSHLNRDKIEYNLSVPGSQGHQENAFIKSFEMSPHVICL